MEMGSRTDRVKVVQGPDDRGPTPLCSLWEPHREALKTVKVNDVRTSISENMT